MSSTTAICAFAFESSVRMHLAPVSGAYSVKMFNNDMNSLINSVAGSVKFISFDCSSASSPSAPLSFFPFLTTYNNCKSPQILFIILMYNLIIFSFVDKSVFVLLKTLVINSISSVVKLVIKLIFKNSKSNLLILYTFSNILKRFILVYELDKFFTF